MSRQELVGTYVVDIVAMTFSMPNLLFPAVAEAFSQTPGNGATYLGWLHSGIAIGALIASLTSGWTRNIRRHGVMVLWAAGSWSAMMIGFGAAKSFPLAMGFLILAGYADMVSGVFRSTIWNQTVPTELRGRLAGIEMISYLSGPMLGNTQPGFLAGHLGVRRAITLSSLIGLCAVCGCTFALPSSVATWRMTGRVQSLAHKPSVDDMNQRKQSDEPVLGFVENRSRYGRCAPLHLAPAP